MKPINLTHCGLIPAPSFDNIASLTKNQQRQSKVLNSAFFVPKIHQAWYLLKSINLGLSTRKSARILKYGRVNEQNKRPHSWGNMFGRLLAISDTRSPVTIAGEQILLKPTGGHAMPNTSKMGKTTPTDFSFSINLPAQSFIKRFVAMYSGYEWLLSVETEAGQRAFIQEANHKNKRFPTLDSLALWLGSQGVLEMSVFLTINGGRA